MTATDDTPLHLRPDFLLDLRVRERHLAAGVLDASRVQDYLDSLPDSADNAEYVELPEIESGDPAPTVTRINHDDDAQEELLTEEKI